MNKKETKIKETDDSVKEVKEVVQITTRAELKAFITEVHEKVLKDQSPPVFAMAAMQQVMTLEDIEELLDSQSKEILQEIWVKLSQSGFHLRKPPLLFGESEA